MWWAACSEEWVLLAPFPPPVSALPFTRARSSSNARGKKAITQSTITPNILQSAQRARFTPTLWAGVVLQQATTGEALVTFGRHRVMSWVALGPTLYNV